jgi:flagellar biosynthetic protein FliR
MPLISIAQAQLFVLAFTRLMAMLVQVPVLGSRGIPARVRIGLGILLTMLLIPWQPLPAGAPALSALEMALALLREIILGTLAGFAATATQGAVQTAGEIMGLSGGFGSGRVVNPTLNSNGTALDQLFLLIATLLFLVLNGHHLVLIAIQKSFQLVPVNGPLPAPLLGDPVQSAGPLLTLLAQMISLGTLMALPVVASAILADVTLGLLSRVAPQVQVFFFDAPLKVGLTLTTLTVSLTLLAPMLGDLMKAIGPRMLHLLGA